MKVELGVLLLALAACGEVGACGAADVHVARARDGDTVELADGEVVRYLGVDTPERGDCFGAEAAQANAALVVDTDARLDDDTLCRDVYGRRLAYVSVGDIDVGGWLLGHGYARLDIVPPNDARAAEYRRLADVARGSSRGLWSACR